MLHAKTSKNIIPYILNAMKKIQRVRNMGSDYLLRCCRTWGNVDAI